VEVANGLIMAGRRRASFATNDNALIAAAKQAGVAIFPDVVLTAFALAADA
jgi:hypothetical protein